MTDIADATGAAGRDIPIIFSGPMIRSLLDGRKTMTRRLAWSTRRISHGGPLGDFPTPWQKVKPGDRLWVRESLRSAQGEFLGIKQNVIEARYAADDAPVLEQHGFNIAWTWRGKSLPSIHMPRWASRLTLIVTAVKIERLQALSRDDAIAEGASMRPKCSGFRNMRDGWSMDWSRVGKHSRFATNGPGPLLESDVSLGDPIAAFGSFLNELHGGPNWNLPGKPTPIWDQNPEMVALTFALAPQSPPQIADVEG